MEICVVAYKFGTEQELGEHLGTYHYFIEKMRRLVRLGHRVYVVAPWLSLTKKGSTEIDGILVFRYFPPLHAFSKIPFLVNFMDFWYQKATQQQIFFLDKTKKLSVVYVWQARETGYAVAKIAHRLSAPFIFRQITTWKWHFERDARAVFGQRKWYKVLLRFKLASILDPFLESWILQKKTQLGYAKTIYQRAKRVVFVSRALSEEALGVGLDPAKIQILGVGIETDLFRPMRQKARIRERLGIVADKVIIFIGRINLAEKGLGILLEALALVSAKLSAVKLVVIGGGGEIERVKQIVKSLKIENNVQLAGKQPFERLPIYLNAADVLTVPSLWLEAFGQVTIEAMSCGVPVVTSDIGGSAEINLDRQTGIIVPAGDSTALAEAIIEILSDENLLAQLGANARARVLENYSFEILIEKFLKIVSNVAK